MNSLFPNWYHATRIRVDGDELNKRWEGIESFDKRLKLARALDALRLFNGLPTQDAEFKETYGSIFQSIDPTFRIRKNDNELRILAGASIVKALSKKPNNVGDAIALSLICTNCRGLYSNGMRMSQDVLDVSSNYLLKRASQVRTPDAILFEGNPISGLDEAVATLGGYFSSQQPDKQKAVFAAPFNLLHSTISSQDALISKLSYTLKLQREETNILWWVLGEHSRDLEKPMNTFKLPATALIAGKELADLTAVAPGPRSAPALLDKVLRSAAPELPASITIKEAVNSAPREWREQWVGKINLHNFYDLCPIHSAVQKSVQVPGINDWIEGYNATSLITATQKMSPLDFAIQVNQEALLIRFFGGE